MIRTIGHRIKNADGIVVEVLDTPRHDPAVCAAERIVTGDTDIGMLDAGGRSVLLGYRVKIKTPGAGLKGRIGIVTGLLDEGGIPKARVQDRRENPTWGAWCYPKDIERYPRMMRAS